MSESLDDDSAVGDLAIFGGFPPLKHACRNKFTFLGFGPIYSTPGLIVDPDLKGLVLGLAEGLLVLCRQVFFVNGVCDQLLIDCLHIREEARIIDFHLRHAIQLSRKVVRP